MSIYVRDRVLSPTFGIACSSRNRHMTFCGQSESGYSTNTSGDESWETVAASQTDQCYVSSQVEQATSKLKFDLYQDFPKHSTPNEPQQVTLDCLTYCDFNKDVDTDVIQTSSPPLYYDPLNLRRVTIEPHKILENTKRSHDTMDHVEDENPANLLGLHAIPLDIGVSLELSDSHHKSAFTPVAPSKKLTSNANGLPKTSRVFTPLKGPSVADYVASCERMEKVKVAGESPLLVQSKSCSRDHKPGSRRTFTTTKTQQDPSVGHDSSRHAIGIMTKDMDLARIKIAHDAENYERNRIGASASSRAEELVNSAVRLRHFLDISSANDLKRLLQEQLDPKDPAMIAAMSIVIPESASARTESHCVRCHKNFNPSKRSRCLMPHPEFMVCKIHQDKEGADFVCQCCKTAFRLHEMTFHEKSTNATFTGRCCSGQHTTDPFTVDHKIRGTTKSCHEGKCRFQIYV